ncbi:MAG: hypothetical protein DRI61_11470, partial [Chloroflexi bacterium]
PHSGNIAQDDFLRYKKRKKKLFSRTAAKLPCEKITQKAFLTRPCWGNPLRKNSLAFFQHLPVFKP